MGLSLFSKRRLILGGAIILGLAFLGTGRLRGTSVDAIQVKRSDLLQTVVTTGRVTSLAKVDLASQILGAVAAVRVDAGDRVNAGDVLIQLRDDEARAALEQARATVRELAERLKQIGAVDSQVSQQKLVEAETSWHHAQRTYDRVKTLHDGGITSRAELDEAIRVRDLTASTVERERLLRTNSKPQGSDIKLAEARLGQARAAVDVARERLERTVIRSPGAGTVILRSVEVGDIVQPGSTLLVLSRDGRTQITAQVDEKNLGMLRVGQNAVASADAYPDKTFPAKLATVVPAVDPLRGTVDVRCDVSEPPSYLVPDMTISLEIAVARHAQVLTVATEAVHDLATTPWVLVARNGRATRQNVKLGIHGSGACEVTSGLQEGDLVLAASSPLAVGARIRARSADNGKHRAH